MAKRPDPAPRAHLTRQVEVCSDDMEKEPPPVAPKTYKAIKLVGQPLPGMVRSCSESECNQQSENRESNVQKNNVEDGVGSLTLQSTNQTLSKSNIGAQEKRTTNAVLVNQQSLPEDSRQTFHSQKYYERSLSFPTPNNQFHQNSQDHIEIMDWWYSEEPWKKLETETSGPGNVDGKVFTQKAENLKKALYVCNSLLSERGANLQGHILELEQVANGIDKVHKGVKIARITGGAAGAAGAAAVVGGIVLAPFTAGATLAVAAVGVGVAAAGGVTGAGAAITNKVQTNMDRKKVETILKEHSTQIEELERCVKFISTHIEFLKKYELSTLKGVSWKAVKIARVAHKIGDSVGAIGAVSKSSGMIQGLALGLDMYFNKEDSKQLKKGMETKFSKKIRKVAKQMQASLDEMMKFKTVLESEDI